MLIKRLALAATLAAASLTIAPSAAQASFCKIGYNCVQTYYSDASHTTAVGRYQVDCRGTIYETGTTSAYFTYNSYACD
ncbi:DUF6289 family protein [Nonomuraea sp. NPDC050451]|uniref:DUF6289 family protein n=1 Tax=Nonomuraea sp. NPDC050451 TaxID=3364364 RepID=UPI0037BBFEC3